MIQDSDMIFDKETRRYRLTNEYVFNNLGIDLDIALIDESDTNLSTIKERTLIDTSDSVYEFIEDYAVNSISSIYDFTQRTEAHNALKKALGLQLIYFIQNGETSNDAESGIRYNINERAKRALYAQNCLHVKYTQIPNIDKW